MADSYLLSQRRQFPATAYFILRDQRLLTTASGVFKDAEVLLGPSAELTWKALEAAHQAAWATLLEGTVTSAGVLVAERDERIEQSSLTEDGGLQLAPPCRFCEFDGLCGGGAEA